MAVQFLQTGTHLVKAFAHQGKFGGILQWDLRAEMAVMHRLHAVLQALQWAQHPARQQQHGNGGADQHHHQQ